jgi:hypothetical protein
MLWKRGKKSHRIHLHTLLLTTGLIIFIKQKLIMRLRLLPTTTTTYSIYITWMYNVYYVHLCRCNISKAQNFFLCMYIKDYFNIWDRDSCGGINKNSYREARVVRHFFLINKKSNFFLLFCKCAYVTYLVHGVYI